MVLLGVMQETGDHSLQKSFFKTVCPKAVSCPGPNHLAQHAAETAQFGRIQKMPDFWETLKEEQSPPIISELCWDN